MKRAFAAAACLALVGCFEKDVWAGFVYPDKSNLSKYRVVGNFPTLDECRRAAVGLIRQESWSRADFECGLNCKASRGADGPLVCKQTSR